jgi:hypothetical protein
VRYLFSIFLFISINFSTYTVVADLQTLRLTLECSKINQELKSIQEWTESRSLKCVLPDKIEELPNNYCSVDIAKCVPHHLLAYHGKNPNLDGPNCFNLALVIAGVLPSLRYTTYSEMAYFYNSPLCKVLEKNEVKKPGDLGVIVSHPKGRVIHAFIRVSDTLVYSKNGLAKEFPYAMQFYEPMSKSYKEFQKSNCRTSNEIDCETTEQTIRCKSMESYLAEPARMTSRSIAEAFIRLDHSEKCFSINTIHHDPLNWSQKRNFLDSIKVIASYLESKEFKDDLQKIPQTDRSFIVGSINIRLESMLTQLAEEKEKQKLPCVTCYLFSNGIEEALKKNTD